jgi:DNA replication protein DnaC
VLSDEMQKEGLSKPRRSTVFSPGQSGRTDDPPGDPVARSAGAVCQTCQGMQWLRQARPFGHSDFGKLVACDCLLQQRRERRRLELLALSNLTELQQKQTLQTFRPQVKGVQEAVKVVKAFLDHPTGWVVLMGPVGTGKTHLAVAIVNACIEAGMVTLFAAVPDLLDHLRAAFSPHAEVVYDELFERLRNAELLVLDDLGTQRSSPWVDEKLFQLLNHRYNSRRPTVITLNRRAWTFLDERLQSRLSDQSLVQLVSMEETQDYRVHQGKNAALQ